MMGQALATCEHRYRQNIVSTSHTGKQRLGEIRDPADQWQATTGRAELDRNADPAPQARWDLNAPHHWLCKPRRAHASACSVLILVR